jgi:arylsulfatase A-like enzyme
VLPKNRTNEQVAISMDWVPTLLSAAGAEPDASYPPDGVNLLPVLQGRTTPIPRTLFWRYKGNAQRAVRDGDFKYLKIRDNTFLFNVVDDPMERGNLKDLHKDVYNALAKKWFDWNATMLPEVAESNTGGNDANRWADHIGNTSTRQPDNPSRSDTSR